MLQDAVRVLRPGTLCEHRARSYTATEAQTSACCTSICGIVKLLAESEHPCDALAAAEGRQRCTGRSFVACQGARQKTYPVRENLPQLDALLQHPVALLLDRGLLLSALGGRLFGARSRLCAFRFDRGALLCKVGSVAVALLLQTVLVLYLSIAELLNKQRQRSCWVVGWSEVKVGDLRRARDGVPCVPASTNQDSSGSIL